MHNLCVLRGAPGAAHPEFRVEDDARCGIKHGLGFFRQRGVAIEVFPIGVRERLYVPAQHRHPFRAQHMIGRGRTLPCNACGVAAASKRQKLRLGMGGQHHGETRARGNLAPQICELESYRAANPVRPGFREIPGAALCQVRFRAPDQSDHAIIGFLRRISEREDTVIQEHHADGAGMRFRGKLLRAQPRQIEARHYVRNDDHIVAVDFPDAGFPVCRVCYSEYCIGVGVIDIFTGKDGMKYGFHGWRRSASPRELRGQLVHHLRIRQRLELGEPRDVFHAHRREARFLNALQIPAAAFDVEKFLVFAKSILLYDFDRCVAAAVKHQSMISSQQL